MYSSPRIITTPISNNRLNFDERGNRTIVVPSLIQGTLDDVKISEETAIEGEVSGKVIAGKWLQHFVYLKDARVPTWIMDNHNHAFAFWHEALWKWWIQKGSFLVHIDQHTDLATPMALPMKNEEWRMKNEGGRNSPLLKGGKEIQNKNRGIYKEENPPFWIFPFEFCTLEDIEEYTNSVLTIADFIVPALSTGLISEAVMVTGEGKEGVGLYSWQMKNEEWKMKNDGTLIKKSAPVIARNEQSEWRGDPWNSDGLLRTSQWQTYPSIIVDIDLDYFSQGFEEAKTLETAKYWIEKADIITIATSPLFIDPEKALEMLRKLGKSLV